eukprot:CAMPEP_0172838746 /NCGR_PEP_ID=MMETSP1075-20121228/28090_1 /TAXON_ID=2916 /ORGANISM="Ceratium fusus, Strain PA161109" /LENGTH=143 /DNA_ID=CAMNT_0013682301 /DNA_START=20 /DNA_END=448 /DNA_ORIENTATION=-
MRMFRLMDEHQQATEEEPQSANEASGAHGLCGNLARSKWACSVSKDLTTSADSAVARAPGSAGGELTVDGPGDPPPTDNCPGKLPGNQVIHQGSMMSTEERDAASNPYQDRRLETVREKCAQLVTHRFFEPVMSACILVNAIC